MASPIEITDENFEELVLKSELPILVDFWATWCGPCKMLDAPLKEIAAEWDGKMIVGKINIEKNSIVPMNFKVLSIPTLLLFVNGNVVSTTVGALPKPALVAKLKDYVGA